MSRAEEMVVKNWDSLDAPWACYDKFWNELFLPPCQMKFTDLRQIQWLAKKGAQPLGEEVSSSTSFADAKKTNSLAAGPT